MKGSEVLVQSLLKQGVKHVFGVTGGAIIPLYDSLYDYTDKIQDIMCRHEQGAAHMAAGFARACGKPGVCAATSGPGGTNLVTGIMDAYMDSTPMIAIGGQVPTSLIGNDAFQETDMMGVTMPITKHNFQIRDPAKIGETIAKAFYISTGGRPGPVYIDIPKDVQTVETTSNIPDKIQMDSYRPTIKPSKLQLKRAVEAILKAERPLIIAGGGCIISGAQDALVDFVNTAHIPTNTTTMGKGIFPENHPLSLGVMGMHGEEQANYAAIHCDCMIAIGCRFSDRITGDTKLFAQDATVIHSDIDPTEIGKNVKVDVPIVGNAKDVLEGLKAVFLEIAGKDKYKKEPWVKKLKDLQKLTHDHEEKDIKGMSAAHILKILNKFKQDSDIVTTGVGQHQMFGEHFLTFTQPRTWITSGGAGTMGYGLPAAMGAKLAKPDCNVYDLDGDGSFQMTSQELATCMQHNIKVVPIILNNSYLGMVRQWLEIFQESRHSGVSYKDTNPDFVKLAQAYHLDGMTVSTPEQFKQALDAAQKSDQTYVIDVKVEKEENIMPMLPPGKGLQHIIGGKSFFKQTWDEVR